MGASHRSGEIIRFGSCQLDLSTGELRRNGLKVRLQDQPFRVLALLLEHPGQLLTREQLQNAIWPKDTFVDFDEGLDAAIYRLRRALGDSGEKPRFIETLARRGYRFIGRIDAADPSVVPVEPMGEPRPAGVGGNGDAAKQIQTLGLAGPGAAIVPARGRLSRILAAAELAAILIALAFVLFRLGESPARTAEEDNAVSTSAAIRSLVVLPLENLSGDPSQEYFADGMTELLTTDLGSLTRLSVISRTSAMHYKGTRKTLPDIARELGVDAVVAGSVVRSGNRLRITAQLIQARTDRQLWASSYEATSTDTLALQDNVARSIAERVLIELSPAERARLSRFHTIDPVAEESYFRGRAEANSWSRAGLQASIGYFGQAIQVDPKYAEAWAGLAGTYQLLGLFGYMPQARARAETKAAAERAVELDGTLSEAHVSLASAMWPLLESNSASADSGRQAWLAAERELRLAISLNPNNAMAHQWLGYYLSAVGRFDEAIPEMRRALELDPLSPNTKNSLGAAYYWAGKYPDALEQFQQVPDPDANSERRHLRMARIYERESKLDRSIDEMAAALRFAGETGLAEALAPKCRSSGFHAAKNFALEGDIREKMRSANRPGVPAPALDVAGDYAMLGKTDASLHWLEVAERQGGGGIAYLKFDDRFDSLHSNPRFQKLLQRIGLLP